MRFLWDTGLLIHAVRQSVAFSAIDANLRLTAGDVKPVISIVTEGEIKAFAIRKQWGKAKMDILTEIFSDCLNIPIEESGLVDEYASIQAEGARSGANLGQNDIWIAATARRYGMQILTMDGDFSRCVSLPYIQFDDMTGQIVGRRD